MDLKETMYTGLNWENALSLSFLECRWMQLTRINCIHNHGLYHCGMVGGRKHCHFLLLRNESLSFVSNFTAISDYQLGKGYNPWLWMQLILVNCIHIHSKKESDNAFSQFNPAFIVSFKSPSPLLLNLHLLSKQHSIYTG